MIGGDWPRRFALHERHNRGSPARGRARRERGDGLGSELLADLLGGLGEHGLIFHLARVRLHRHAFLDRHDVNVQMDRDNSIQKFATDYDLREGDRVRVQADGKVAPL